MIRKRPLGKTGFQVTEIGFGALEIGRDWAPDVNPDPTQLSQPEAARVLNGILDLGINLIDTAPAYWFSEEYIGQSIAHRRKEYVLATKVGEKCDRSGSVYDYSAKATAEFIDTSLKKLRTDHIDLIQIHSAAIEVLEKGETLGAMQKAREAGKVLHIGMTGGVPECIRAIELGGYETVQVPYSLLHLDAEDRLLPLAQEKGIGVIIMRGLAGGKLTPKFQNLENRELRDAIRGFLRFTGSDMPIRDLPHLALGYVLAHPAVSSVIPGSRRVEAVQDNLFASLKPIPPGMVAKIRAYAKFARARAW